MKALTVGDVLCPEGWVVRVSADDRPPTRRQTSTIYAVFGGEPPTPESGPFQGLVTEREISFFPQRIFGDLVEPHAFAPCMADTPLDAIFRNTADIAFGIDAPLPVVDEGGAFIGVVTRNSVLEGLLRRERQLLKEMCHLNEMLELDRSKLADWSSRLTELHEASSNVMGLLTHATQQADFLQNGIDAFSRLVRARYGAIGILENGQLRQFVYTGMSAEEASRIGRLPEGRGLLGVVVKECASLRLDDLTQDPRSVGFPRHHPAMKTLLAVPITHGNRVLGRVYLCDKEDGQPFTHEDEILTQSLAQSLSLALESAERMEEMKRVTKQLDIMANFDGLTGLPNRELFMDRLRQATRQATRTKDLVGILFLDLDNFKLINDTFGHTVGDDLLQRVGDRIVRCLRDTDTVARFGGDEFAILADHLEDAYDAALIAQKVLETLAPPFLLNGHEAYLTASIGIALYPDNGASAVDVVKNADTAMYHAKGKGKYNFQFYSVEMNAKVQRRLLLEWHLRCALQNGELTLHYQPLVDVYSPAIVGVEALLRWFNPELGVVSPDEFIPIAEETGLIFSIGEWVLKEACRQVKSWRSGVSPHLRVAVNISSRQFCQSRLAATVAECLREYDLPAESLELEVTESVMMECSQEVLDVLRDLKVLGVRVAIDDFGTGYSSLSYLKRLPIDMLKIDRSFVQDVVTNLDDAAIVTAIIALADVLKLQTLAEGVETTEQMEFLRERRCGLVQGYLLGSPEPAEEMSRRLAAGVEDWAPQRPMFSPERS